MRHITLLAIMVASISISAEAQRTVEWESWTPVACYPGLDFRVGHTGPPLADGNYIVHAQFRNRYRVPIYFDYVVREPGAETPVEYRTLEGIAPQNVGPVTEFIGDFSPEFYLPIPPGNAAEVVVDGVRMETDEGRRLASEPGCSAATVSAPTSAKPRLTNPIQVRTERSHDLSTRRILMYNESDEILIVSVILYECENIRNPCDVSIPIDDRLDPGEESQVLVVRPRNEDRAWGFRFRFTWDLVP